MRDIFKNLTWNDAWGLLPIVGTLLVVWGLCLLFGWPVLLIFGGLVLWLLWLLSN
jgi:hypothetical protein